MQNENKRALVVDLSYQVHRYLSVPQMSELRNKDKVKVGGVFGVLKALNNALSNDCFSKVICCSLSLSCAIKHICTDLERTN